MVKYLLLASSCFATVAVAQTFPKPPDVPAFAQVVPIYKTTAGVGTVIDPAVTPPSYTGLTNIPVPSTTGRIDTSTNHSDLSITGSISGTTLTVTVNAGRAIHADGSDYIYGSGITTNTQIMSQLTGTAGSTGTYTVNNLQTVGSETINVTDFAFCTTVLNGGPLNCDTAKFRTQANITTLLADDPVRNFGQPGTSHPHMFFGGASCNAYSTYKSIRKHSISSAAAGVDVNGTCYWFPAVEVLNPYSDGKNFALKPDYVSIYYLDSPAMGMLSTPLVPGVRYVFGWDMDAATYTTPYAWLQTYLDTANTTIGHTRYTIKGPSGTFYTQANYQCIGATATGPYGAGNNATDSGHANYIVNPDGSDPWGGTCTAGKIYVMDISGADCWDGTNPWSPGGYKNIIPVIYDNDNSTWACPTNYYKVPSLEIKLTFNQNGFADYGRWILSSDLAYRAAHSLTSTQVPPGFTLHTDWMHGWDQVHMLKWQQNCIGSGHNTPHQCNNSVISGTEGLIGGGSSGVGAGGRNPQVDLTTKAHVNETDPGWAQMPSSFTAAMSGMQVHQ